MPKVNLKEFRQLPLDERAARIETSYEVREALLRSAHEVIQRLPGELSIMNRWSERTYCPDSECQTAHCIGGWLAIVAGAEGGTEIGTITDAFERHSNAAKAYEALFYLQKSGMTLNEFDALKPDIRKAAMLAAIDNMLKIGIPLWESALRKANVCQGIEE